MKIKDMQHLTIMEQHFQAMSILCNSNRLIYAVKMHGGCVLEVAQCNPLHLFLICKKHRKQVLNFLQWKFKKHCQPKEKKTRSLIQSMAVKCKALSDHLGPPTWLLAPLTHTIQTTEPVSELGNYSLRRTTGQTYPWPPPNNKGSISPFYVN